MFGVLQSAHSVRQGLASFFYDLFAGMFSGMTALTNLFRHTYTLTFLLCVLIWLFYASHYTLTPFVFQPELVMLFVAYVSCCLSLFPLSMTLTRLLSPLLTILCVLCLCCGSLYLWRRDLSINSLSSLPSGISPLRLLLEAP